MRILSHVDVRVRDRAKAHSFYDALFMALGVERYEGPTFTTYQSEEDGDWFGITEDAAATPSPTRISLYAPDRATVDRIARMLPGIGATNLEMDDGIYGPDYYAVFFDDPDGNALELAYVRPASAE